MQFSDEHFVKEKKLFFVLFSNVFFSLLMEHFSQHFLNEGTIGKVKISFRFSVIFCHEKFNDSVFCVV